MPEKWGLMAEVVVFVIIITILIGGSGNKDDR